MKQLEPQKLNVNRSQYPTIWLDEPLDQNLAVLAWRLSLLSGDRIGRHYLQVGRHQYAIYQRLRCPRARRHAWEAISRGFRWIEHLDQGWTS